MVTDEEADDDPCFVVSQTHKGDMYVLYSIAFPRALTEEQKLAVMAQFPPDTAFGHDEL